MISPFPGVGVGPLTSRRLVRGSRVGGGCPAGPVVCGRGVGVRGGRSGCSGRRRVVGVVEQPGPGVFGVPVFGEVEGDVTAAVAGEAGGDVDEVGT
jgi:hypothetical protein